MKHLIISIALGLMANVSFGATVGSGTIGKLDYALGVGVAKENINWTINAPGTTVNVISELDYTDVESTGMNFDFLYQFRPKLRFGGHITVATITDGTVRDSDYCGPNRTGEFSRSISEVSGERLDYNFFLQHHLIQQNKLSLHIHGGYALHQQNLGMKKGTQVAYTPTTALPCDSQLTNISPDPMTPAELNQLNAILQSDLNSSFDQTWRGPWVGLNAAVEKNKFVLQANLNYYLYQSYHAEAYWNLRNLPYSFNATATGFTLNTYLGYRISKKLELGFSTHYFNFSSSRGNEVLSNDCSPLPSPCVTNNFNGATWESDSLLSDLRISLRYSKF